MNTQIRLSLQNSGRKIGRAGWVAAIALATLTQNAFAVTTLRQVQVSGTSQVDLLFDQKIAKGQYKTEFFNDTIQVTFSEASVYPAKISSVAGNALTKVFTYQYAPKVVRCRLTVKGKAEDYKNRMSLVGNGKLLTLKISDRASESAAAHASATAAESSASVNPSKASAAAATANEAALAQEEKVLLERVIREKAPAPNAASSSGRGNHSDSIGSSASAPSHSANANARSGLASNRNPGLDMSSTASILIKLLGVLTLFGVGAVLLRKFILNLNSGNRSSRQAPIIDRTGGGLSAPKLMSGALSRFIRSNFGSGNKPIEVLATHYLGPKKNIAVVRVSGKVLILGVTAEAVNLITEMSQADYFAQQEQEELTGDPAIDEEMRRIGPVTRNASSYAGNANGGNASSTGNRNNHAGAGANAAGGGIFAQILGQLNPQQGPGSTDAFQNPAATVNIRGPQAAASTNAHARTASNIGGTGIKAQIRNKLEGLKPL